MRYSKKVADLIHSFGPKMTYVTNWGYTFLQPEPVPDYIDFLSSDIGGERRTEMVSFLSHYHDAERVPWDALISNWITGTGRWNGPDFRPKSPDYFNQEYAVVASHGGRAHIWSSRDRGGPEGEDFIPPYDIILTEHLANFMHSRDEVFKGTEPVRRVAVLHSATTFYEDGRGLYGHGPVLDRIAGANLALRQNHLSFQILNEDYLLENLDSYKVVVLSQQTHLPERVTDALRRWVDKGGSLIMTGLSATKKDLSGKATMTLGDVLGVEFVESDTINPGLIATGPIPFKMALTIPFYPVQLKTARSCIPLQKSNNPYDAETLPYPAVTINNFGKGKAIYISADIFSRYMNFQEPGLLRLVDEIMKNADPFPQIETDAPKCITFALRKKGRNLIANMVNEGVDWDTKGQGAFYVENIPPIGPVAVKIRCSFKPTKVYGVPEIGDVQWRWDTDGVWVKVPSVHIHQALVLEKAFEK
ncbi:MAG: beta-galactosidase trimerization domain-containing protein [Patescibacteria group bacterium]|nr:beta-galactosidase trimerization domain-containing protein [Patescibacteria group bacterium]